MTELPFQKLLELVNFDQHVHKTRIETKNLHTEIGQLEVQVDKHNEQLQVFKNKWQEAKHEVALKELEMKELDEAEKKASNRLDNLQDPKEYQSIKKEIEYLKTKQHEYEQVLLTAWNGVETAEREYKNKHLSYDEEIKKLQTTLAEKRTQMEEKQKMLNEAESQRVAKIQNIPPEWLEKYERMQSRVPNPVVPAINDSCSACNVRLLAQDIIQLRNRALLQCKNCYRFLYLESAMQG
jgi:predicted  nucleic acid-binding Zn-ribbon protein